jgi:hypothetical protein
VPSSGLKIFRKVFTIGLVCAGLVACSALSKDGGVVWALVSYGLAVAAWPRVSAEKRAAAARAYSAAKTEWEGALSRWKREGSRDAFAKKLKALEQARGSGEPAK